MNFENTDFCIFQYSKKHDNWGHAKKCIPDQPYNPDVSGAYLPDVPDDVLVNVQYNEETKDLTMNYSVSYGMITKNEKAHPIKVLPEGMKNIGTTNRDYYVIYTKGDNEYFAVVPKGGCMYF